MEEAHKITHGGQERNKHDTHTESIDAKLERLQGVADPESGALHGRTDPTESMHTAGADRPVIKGERKYGSKIGPLETEHKGPHRKE